MDKIVVKQGEKYIFEEKFTPKTTTNLWASVSIKSGKGFFQLASSRKEVFVDGHKEIVRFEFPELEPGEYEYVVTIGDPFEGIAKLEGVLVVEEKAKKAPLPKKTSQKKEPVVTKVKADNSGVFTSSSFFGEEDDGESGSGVEMP